MATAESAATLPLLPALPSELAAIKRRIGDLYRDVGSVACARSRRRDEDVASGRAVEVIALLIRRIQAVGESGGQGVQTARASRGSFDRALGRPRQFAGGELRGNVFALGKNVLHARLRWFEC